MGRRFGWLAAPALEQATQVRILGCALARVGGQLGQGELIVSCPDKGSVLLIQLSDHKQMHCDVYFSDVG
jgi:hypothetical protein